MQVDSSSNIYASLNDKSYYDGLRNELLSEIQQVRRELQSITTTEDGSVNTDPRVSSVAADILGLGQEINMYV